MAFMKPEITEDKMVLVETDAGDWLVPTDVYDPEKPLDCTEGSELYRTEHVSGWFARLSAPGFLDCTDWMGPFETEWEARAELSESFEVCAHCGNDLDDAGCPDCGADHTSLTDRPDYVGDVDYCHGGVWFNLSDWKWGYVNAIEVCPVPGFDGAVWVSPYVTLTPEAETVDEALEDEHVKRAIECCGWLDEEEIREHPGWRLILTSMLFDYGRKDPDSYISPVIIQTDAEGEMEGDGVKADYRIPDGTALDLFLAERVNWASEEEIDASRVDADVKGVHANV